MTTQTLQVAGDDSSGPNDAPDTISISVTKNPLPLPPGGFLYNYKGTSLPAGGVNANALRVFGYGGNDDITVTGAPGAWVSGNTGDDKITLVNCNNVQITSLTPSDSQNGRPVDGADTIDLQGSTWTNADGGDSKDTFTSSGDNSNSTLYGGPGPDDFAIGGTFSNGIIHGDDDDDIVTGSGFWPNASVHGDAGDDRIDLRACTGMNISLYGEDGNDFLYAGSWGNNLTGGAGRDRMVGGVGDDWFYAVDGNSDTVIGGAHDKGDHAEIDWPNPDESIVDWASGVEFVTYDSPA